MQRYTNFVNLANFKAKIFIILSLFCNFVLKMQQKLHSIVLKTVKYGDNQLIVDVLSRETGRQSVVWRLPKRGKMVGRNIFQPLTQLEMECEQKGSTSLPLLKDAHITYPYTSLHTDPVKMSVCFFLAEFLCLATRAEQPDNNLFDFAEQSLQWYDLASSATANFHLMFLVRLSRFLGFYPDMETWHEGALFDLRAAEFSDTAPLHRDFLRVDESRYVSLIMRMTPSNMHRFLLSHTERNHAIEVMLRFYELHIPGFRELKSWQVLKEVFKGE